MKVRNFLPKVRATKTTYYNLQKGDIKAYKKLYTYLKKHQDKSIYLNGELSAKAWLSLKNELDFIKKFRAMVKIAENIRWAKRG